MEEKMFKQKNKVALIILGLVFLSICFYSICHSTPQRAIRTNLFFNGYVIKALKTEICVSNEDPWVGMYYCINPPIGSDFYAVKKDNLGFWHIDYKKSGGA